MMLAIRKILISLILSAIIVVVLPVNANDYISKTLNVGDGLSRNTINAILRDSRGFLWLGTDYGINRYDNNSVRQYHSAASNGQIATGHVIALHEDSIGGIWIATDGGLTRYYPETDRFRHFTDSNGNRLCVQDAIVKEDRIIFGGKDGILVEYDYSGDSVRVTRPDGWPKVRARTFAPLNDGRYLTLTRREGIWIFDPEANKIDRFDKIDAKSVMAIAVDSLQQVWVAVYGTGLYKYNLNGDFLALFTDKEGLYSNMVTDLIVYDNKLYVASEGGLEAIDVETDEITKRPFNGVANKVGAIRTIYFDEYGNFYIGSVRNGVTMIQKSLFRTFSFAENGKAEMSVTAFVPDKGGIIWCSVDGNGIYKIHPTTNQIDHIQSTERQKAVGMIEWPNNMLLYSVYGGDIELLDKNTGQRHPSPDFVRRLGVNARNHELGAGLFKDTDSTFFVISDSLYVVNPYTKTVLTAHPDTTNNNVAVRGKMQFVYADSEQILTLWYRTIYRTDRNTMLMEAIAESPQGQLYCARFDGQNTIYMATSDSIYQHELRSGRTEPFLFSQVNNINSMVFVDQMLWFGASNRLFLTDGTRLQSFDSGDGVSPNEFLPNSNYIDSTYIYFGGTNGMARVNRYELAENGKNSHGNFRISLAELDIDGQPAMDRVENGRIKLPAHNAMVRIKVVCNESNQIRGRIYRFYLDGLDFTRPFETLEPSLTLGEMPSGRKINIRVSCTKPDGEWTRPVSLLTLDIAQVWWLSWWFIILVIIVVAAMGAAIYRLIHQNWRNNATRQRMHVLERDVQILANINDSMRAPIASVVKPIHEALDQLACDEEIDQEQLESDLSNALESLESMQAMVDNPFGMLHPQNLSIEPVILSARFNVWLSEQIEIFIKGHRSKGRIDLVFDPRTDPGMITMNASRLEIIISCMLSELTDAGATSFTVTIDENHESGCLKVSFINTEKADSIDWDVCDNDSGDSLKVMYARWLAELDGVKVSSALVDGVLAGVALEFAPTKDNVHVASVASGRVTDVDKDGKEIFTITSLSGCSVLLVSPDNDQSQILANRIEMDFKEIYIRDTAIEAIEAVRTYHPEVVVIDGTKDVEMAVEVVTGIKSDAELPDTAVIIVTSGNASRIREKAPRFGGDAYLESPFDKNVLLKLCMRLLGLNDL